MSYTKVGPFVDGGAPYLSAATFNTIETNVANMRIDQWYNVVDFGAKGDGTTDDTTAVQNAVNAALNATAPGNWQAPPYTGTSPTVYFPMGAYVVGEITINGTVNLRGQGSYLYGASMLLQKTAGSNILTLGPDTDGQTNSSVIERLAFRSRSGTSSNTVAQIKTSSTATFASSLYIRNCWFESPENVAIWMTQGGDFEIQGCTFDQSAYGAIKLGVAGTTASYVNASRIVNNTFAGIALSCIELANAGGIVINSNRLINTSPGASSTFVLTSNVPGTSVARFTATGNTVDGVYRFAQLATAATTASDAQAAVMSGNVIRNVSGAVVQITGGGIYYNLNFTGNAIKNPSGTVLAEGAAFKASGTGVQISVISHNTILASATTALLFDMADSRVQTNSFTSNPSLNFTTTSNFTGINNNL